MAKKSEVNKSALIREALAAHRGTAPAEIAKMLNEKHGLKLTGQYVSTIKSNAAKKRGRRGGRRVASKVHPVGTGFSAVGSALEFVKAAGGMEAAKAALGTLEEIAGVVR